MNNKYIIIDNRMRSIEKKYLKSLGYCLIELLKNDRVYDEISSHVDIFVSKTENSLIMEPTVYNYILSKINEKANIQIIMGDTEVNEKYPFDIPYNVCIISNYAIHNFIHTSKKVSEVLKNENYNLINVNQGYSNCSIAVIDENSIIINDRGLYKVLSKHDFDILFIEDDLDIKLLKNNGEYSSKKGFIGGCIARIDNRIIVFGDLNKIDKKNQLRDFIVKKGLEIIDFKDLDVIDYGGIVVV